MNIKDKIQEIEDGFNEDVRDIVKNELVKYGLINEKGEKI